MAEVANNNNTNNMVDGGATAVVTAAAAAVPSIINTMDSLNTNNPEMKIGNSTTNTNNELENMISEEHNLSSGLEKSSNNSLPHDSEYDTASDLEEDKLVDDMNSLNMKESDSRENRDKVIADKQISENSEEMKQDVISKRSFCNDNDGEGKENLRDSGVAKYDTDEEEVQDEDEDHDVLRGDISYEEDIDDDFLDDHEEDEDDEVDDYLDDDVEEDLAENEDDDDDHGSSINETDDEHRDELSAKLDESEIQKKKVDEDRSNPQYIPKRGAFYEHDDRTSDVEVKNILNDMKSDGASGKSHVLGGRLGIAGVSSASVNSGSSNHASLSEESGNANMVLRAVTVKSKKNTSSTVDRWTHDCFNTKEQAPKSSAELVSAYGYDIRTEEGPPKALRHHRYSRGPSKYVRKWEDEQAYLKTNNKDRKPLRRSDFPALNDLRKSNRRTRQSSSKPTSVDGDNSVRSQEEKENQVNRRDHKSENLEKSSRSSLESGRRTPRRNTAERRESSEGLKKSRYARNRNFRNQNLIRHVRTDFNQRSGRRQRLRQQQEDEHYEDTNQKNSNVTVSKTKRNNKSNISKRLLISSPTENSTSSSVAGNNQSLSPSSVNANVCSTAANTQNLNAVIKGPANANQQQLPATVNNNKSSSSLLPLAAAGTQQTHSQQQSSTVANIHNTPGNGKVINVSQAAPSETVYKSPSSLNSHVVQQSTLTQEHLSGQQAHLKQQLTNSKQSVLSDSKVAAKLLPSVSPGGSNLAQRLHKIQNRSSEISKNTNNIHHQQQQVHTPHTLIGQSQHQPKLIQEDQSHQVIMNANQVNNQMAMMQQQQQQQPQQPQQQQPHAMPPTQEQQQHHRGPPKRYSSQRRMQQLENSLLNEQQQQPQHQQVHHHQLHHQQQHQHQHQLQQQLHQIQHHQIQQQQQQQQQQVQMQSSLLIPEQHLLQANLMQLYHPDALQAHLQVMQVAGQGGPSGHGQGAKLQPTYAAGVPTASGGAAGGPTVQQQPPNAYANSANAYYVGQPEAGQQAPPPPTPQHYAGPPPPSAGQPSQAGAGYISVGPAPNQGAAVTITYGNVSAPGAIVTAPVNPYPVVTVGVPSAPTNSATYQNYNTVGGTTYFVAPHVPVQNANRSIVLSQRRPTNAIPIIPPAMDNRSSSLSSSSSSSSSSVIQNGPQFHHHQVVQQQQQQQQQIIHNRAPAAAAAAAHRHGSTTSSTRRTQSSLISVTSRPKPPISVPTVTSTVTPPVGSPENIDHIIDNMFVQRPVFQPLLRSQRSGSEKCLVSSTTPDGPNGSSSTVNSVAGMDNRNRVSDQHHNPRVDRSSDLTENDHVSSSSDVVISPNNTRNNSNSRASTDDEQEVSSSSDVIVPARENSDDDDDDQQSAQNAQELVAGPGEESNEANE